MSKKNVQNKKILHLATDKQLGKILDSISIALIFEYDIKRCEELLNQILVDAYITRDEESLFEKLNEASFLLSDKIVNLINSPDKIRDITYMLLGDVDEDVISEEVVMQLIKLFPHLARNKNEFYKYLKELEINALNKLTTFLNLKIEEEMNMVTQRYIENLELLKHLLSELREEEEEDINEFTVSKKMSYSKIFDFRTLEKLILDKGFELKSIEGSHHKYQNTEGEIVMLPRHAKDLGKGLSIAIQKRVDK